ncbi:hypothetical protein [Actinoallomurus sp. NPDC052274]|uniref:hypothetical protein n=1 Tax=Actinoallomurus sp. NPDC052274 TaxID=3155420 RepID=UPI003442F792
MDNRIAEVETDEIGMILPGDTLVRHPDHPEQPCELVITEIRRFLRDHHQESRVDYRAPDGSVGCITEPIRHRVEVAHTANVHEILRGLSDQERFQMLAFLSGFCRDGFATALARVQDQRDAVARQAERMTEATG